MCVCYNCLLSANDCRTLFGVVGLGGGGGGVVSSFECMSFLFVHFLLFLKCCVGACSVNVDFF